MWYLQKKGVIVNLHGALVINGHPVDGVTTNYYLPAIAAKPEAKHFSFTIRKNKPKSK